MSKLATPFGQIEIAEYVPTATESDVAPFIAALREADDKSGEQGANIAYVEFPDEKTAEKYRVKIQRAVRPGNTAKCTVTKSETGDGFILGVRLVAPFKRPDAESAEEVASE